MEVPGLIELDKFCTDKPSDSSQSTRVVEVEIDGMEVVNFGLHSGGKNGRASTEGW